MRSWSSLRRVSSRRTLMRSSSSSRFCAKTAAAASRSGLDERTDSFLAWRGESSGDVVALGDAGIDLDAGGEGSGSGGGEDRSYSSTVGDCAGDCTMGNGDVRWLGDGGSAWARTGTGACSGGGGMASLEFWRAMDGRCTAGAGRPEPFWTGDGILLVERAEGGRGDRDKGARGCGEGSPRAEWRGEGCASPLAGVAAPLDGVVEATD